MTCCEHGIKRGSSVKWIDISHKLYKKAGIMYLCSDQTSRTWIPSIMQNALGVFQQDCQKLRYEDNNLVLEIQTPKEKLCCPVCGTCKLLLRQRKGNQR